MLNIRISPLALQLSIIQVHHTSFEGFQTLRAILPTTFDSLYFLAWNKEFSILTSGLILSDMLTVAKNQHKFVITAVDRPYEFTSVYISTTCFHCDLKRVQWKIRCISYQLNLNKTWLCSLVL